MAAAGEHGAWCQDMCPCVPYENMSVAPPQGFWDNRYLRRLGVENGTLPLEEVAEREWEVEAHFQVSQRRSLV